MPEMTFKRFKDISDQGREKQEVLSGQWGRYVFGKC
jgi:hypothetical protein